ncbi:MAG: membrane integrity-associated transporter subunit PqiC [Pseudomonadales bacterium]|nr:membrane integrity-associated transporter subunit PqiC [Pseudomonadales bacterium]
MSLRALLPLSFTLALTACGLLRAPPPPPLVHDFGAAPAAAQTLPWQLGVQVGAPIWLDDGAIHYRHAGATRLAAYRDHRWAAPPSDLLARRLRTRLAPPNPGAAGRWLELELTGFEQRFAADGTAAAHLGARAQLFDRRGGKLLASHDFERVLPAASSDVHGGVAALAAAADALAVAVLDWLAAWSEQEQP